MNTIALRNDRVFFSVALTVFVASLAITVAWCMAMSAMGDMPMPGGWSMSMAWMPMGEQTWLDAGLTFVGMWTVMMVAMMLPSLVPMLRRYRDAVRGERARGLTLVAGAGYFAVWVLLGVAAFPLGALVTSLEMDVPALARAVPLAVGIIVLVAGALQFTAWKQRHLACCRGEVAHGGVGADLASAWRHGLRLGVHCSYCCAGMTAVLLVIGVMDLYAMAVVMAAITIERLAPNGERAAHVIGGVVVAVGALLIGRAIG